MEDFFLFWISCNIEVKIFGDGVLCFVLHQWQPSAVTPNCRDGVFQLLLTAPRLSYWTQIVVCNQEVFLIKLSWIITLITWQSQTWPGLLVWTICWSWFCPGKHADGFCPAILGLNYGYQVPCLQLFQAVSVGTVQSSSSFTSRLAICLSAPTVCIQGEGNFLIFLLFIPLNPHSILLLDSFFFCTVSHVKTKWSWIF